MEKILVTGACGFLGSAIVKRLRETRIDCYAVNHADLDVSSREELYDLCCAFKPTVIYHCAGKTGMGQSVYDPDYFFRANVDTTLSVLETCRRLGNVRLIYTSSFAVYGSSESPSNESDALPPPENPYAASKQAAEIYVEMYSRLYGFPATTLRVFSSFGPGQKEYTAIYTFMDAIYRGVPVILFDNGTAKRDYMYIDNAVDGMLLALHHHTGYDVYNLGQNLGMTLKEIVACMEEIVGKKAIIEFRKSPPGVMGTMTADISKIYAQWGYVPQIDFKEGLRRVFAWYIDKNTKGE